MSRQERLDDNISGTFLSQVRGFTPVIDALVEEVGLIPAAIYGVVWRYCQMSDGVCQATLEHIGAKVGLARRTVIRHLGKLVELGYLEDMTPELRNRPHTYRDTGRAHILGLVSARVTESHSARNDQLAGGGVTESHSGVTESHSGGDRESHEETLIRDSMKRRGPPTSGKSHTSKDRPAGKDPEKNFDSKVSQESEIREKEKGDIAPPPAAKAFKQIAKRWPRRSDWARIDEIVGTQQRDIQLWKAVVHDWLIEAKRRDWNPHNIGAMLDRFLRKQDEYYGPVIPDEDDPGPITEADIYHYDMYTYTDLGGLSPA